MTGQREQSRRRLPDSLAARSTSVNSAEVRALRIAYPPGFSPADSMRINATRLASWFDAEPFPLPLPSSSPPSAERTVSVVGR